MRPSARHLSRLAEALQDLWPRSCASRPDLLHCDRGHQIPDPSRLRRRCSGAKRGYNASHDAVAGSYDVKRTANGYAWHALCTLTGENQDALRSNSDEDGATCSTEQAGPGGFYLLWPGGLRRLSTHRQHCLTRVRFEDDVFKEPDTFARVGGDGQMWVATCLILSL